MGNWESTIRIKHLLDKSSITDDEAVHLGKQIADTVKKSHFVRGKDLLNMDSVHFDQALYDIVEALENIDPNDLYLTCAEDAINHRLRDLYDWADARRVWID